MPTTGIRSISTWPVGQPAQVVQLEDLGRVTPEVVWIDLDARDADPTSLAEALRHLCPGVGPKMLEDLFEPDHYPKGKRYDEAGSIRLVSTFAVEVESATARE